MSLITLGLGVALSLALLALVITALNYAAPLFTATALRNLSRKMAGLQLRHMDVQGQAVPYLVGGQGTPLVMVHGFTGDKDTFNALARFLTPHFEVYAIDLLGHGDADRDHDADYSLDAQVARVKTLLNALGLEKAHLAGSSMGGGVIAAYAAQYPHAVSSVWLIGAAATQEAVDSPMVRHYQATGEFPLMARTTAEHAQKMAVLTAKPLFIPYAVNKALSVSGAQDYALHKKMLDTMIQVVPLEQRYSQVPTPALIISGDQDRVIPASSVHTLAKLFPNSQVSILKDIGHIPMTESAQQIAQDYLAFRQSLTSLTTGAA
jgi:pimeloyl-ACP methyl ester carboxylesterase